MKYLEKLSGPLLDRIDLQINIQSIDYDTIKATPGRSKLGRSFYRRQKCLGAQQERFKQNIATNSSMNTQEVEQYCLLTPEAEATIKKAFEALNLSMRGYHKILNVARTIADMEPCNY